MDEIDVLEIVLMNQTILMLEDIIKKDGIDKTLEMFDEGMENFVNKSNKKETIMFQLEFLSKLLQANFIADEPKNALAVLEKIANYYINLKVIYKNENN